MQFVKRFSFLTLLTVGLFCLTTIESAQAQWAIGASYEVKTDAENGEPKSGFGARIDRVIGLPLPLLDLRLRGHFSYFSDENTLSYDISGGNFSGSGSFSKEVKNYDFGAQLIAQLNFIVSPYAGVGIGSENYQATLTDFNSVSGDDPSTLDPDKDSNSMYWTGTAGLSTNAIPVIKPFVEYRFKDAFEPSDLAGANKEFVQGLKGKQSRVIFGILLQF
jgi:opacity protein-like surface antigen